MDIACPLCGASLGEVSTGPSGRLERRCPGCGARLELRRVESPDRDRDPATVFHPQLLSEPAEDWGEATVATPASAAAVGRVEAPQPHAPHAGPEAYLLVLGAPAGRERIPIHWARTVFGRGAADVDLGDPRLADRHFQVEVTGREFYLRDLASGRGTRLNGRDVRYIELLPGDEIAAGDTALVFRTADDGVSRRGT